jgi:hypothetical protein
VHHLHAASTVNGIIQEYGIYKAVGASYSVDNSETVAGKSTVGKFVLTKTTDKVPLKKGISFGLKWSASGFLDTDKIELVHILEHPRITKPNGISSRLSKESYMYKPVNGIISHTEGYTIGKSYEMVPGQYIFSVIYNNNVIIKKSFTIMNNHE